MTKKRLFFSTVIIATVLTTDVFAATTWNVSLWGKRRAFTEHIEKLAELVSAKTNGEFQLNLSYGGLSKNRENLDGISFGAFEMAQFCAGYHPDKNPSITALELPFLGVQTLEEEIAVSMAVYQHPATQKDLARWNAHLLMPSPLPQYNVAGVGTAPATLDDFRGMRIRATGGIGEAMTIAKAVPTSMSATEVRQSLDSGVISAAAFAPHAHMSFGTVESASWWTTNLNPGTVNCPVVVNIDALKDLKPEFRDALLGSVNDALEHYIAYYNNQTMAAWWPLLEEKNIQQVTLPQAEIDRFKQQVAGPVREQWIQEMTKKGLPAQELLNLITTTLQQ